MNTFFPEEHLGRLIVRAHSLLSQTLHRELKAHGIDITAEQWAVLIVLLEEDSISQTQLAERAFKDKPTTTRMIKLMEDQGLIQRQRNKRDQRANRVFLTKKGRSLAQSAIHPASKVLQKAQTGLSDREISELKRMLKIINKNLSV